MKQVQMYQLTCTKPLMIRRITKNALLAYFLQVVPRTLSLHLIYRQLHLQIEIDFFGYEHWPPIQTYGYICMRGRTGWSDLEVVQDKVVQDKNGP